MGKKGKEKKNHKLIYTMESTEGRKEISSNIWQSEKDVGELFDSDLSFPSHNTDMADVDKRASTIIKPGMTNVSFTSIL